MYIDSTQVTLMFKTVKKINNFRNEISSKNTLNEICKKLNVIELKLDQQITSEVKSAFGQINDAIITNNINTMERVLNSAEEKLRKNSNLNLDLSTGTVENKDIVVLCNYGLAFIYSLRDDDTILTKYILEIYALDSEFARRELSPEIYEIVFKPLCKDIYSWHEKRVMEINQKNYTAREFFEKSGALITGVFGFLGGIITRTNASNQLRHGVDEMWNNANPEKYRDNEKLILQNKLENKINIRCSEIAKKMLEIIE